MCANCGIDKCGCGNMTVITERGTAGKSAPALPGKIGPPGPSGTANLPIKYTAFVSKNGNDSTGLVERLDKTFLTINAAINAIAAAYPARTETSRVQVIVFDGNYVQDVILKKYVDIHFFNVVLDGSLTDNQVDFGASTSWTNVITGGLRIYRTGVIDAPAMSIYKKGTQLLMYCHSIGCLTRDAIVILNGIVKIHCDKIHCDDTVAEFNLPIEMAQGFIEPDYTFSSLEIVGADIYRGAGGIGPIVSFAAGGGLKNQKLILTNCRVKNDQATGSDAAKSCIAVGSTLSSNARITLSNTILYAHSGKSIYTQTGDTSVVKCYHSNMSNVAIGGGGTTTVSLGSLTVNASVEAEF